MGEKLIFAAKIEQNHRRYQGRRKIRSHPEPLSQWIETVSTMLPKLSRPQAKVLAYWSYGMVLARSCGITLVCAALARAAWTARSKACCNACANGATRPKTKKGRSGANWM